MILHINDDFSKEVLDKFIESINTLREADNLIILLNSRGGEYQYAQAMLQIINRVEYVNRITLIGYNCLASSAFELFFLAECKKELVNGTIGMYHPTTMPLDYNEKGKLVNNEDIVWGDYLRKFCYLRTRFVCKKIGVEKSILKKIDNQEEVWFTVQQMKMFLKNS